MVHDNNGGLNIHDVILVRLVEQPVIEQGQLSVTSGNWVGTGR